MHTSVFNNALDLYKNLFTLSRSYKEAPVSSNLIFCSTPKISADIPRITYNQ